MRVSLHRRRHESLAPQPARSPRLLIIAALLCTGTVALAASRMGESAPVPVDASIGPAEDATRVVVDERLRAHLKALARP